MTIGDFPLAPTGWICPKCGRVYAPSTPACFCCGGETITTTTTGTSGTIKEYISEWDKYLNHTTVGGSDYWDDIKKRWTNVLDNISNKNLYKDDKIP